VNAPERVLIVNADDFGMSEGVNAGIVAAHRDGIVTSASLMVMRANALEAAELASDLPRLGLGLHIDLSEWEPIDGIEQQVYERVDINDHARVADEIAGQIELFVKLVGRPPDHLDSHQHVHMEGHARSESLRLARELGIPLRGLDDQFAFCGKFYGQQRHFEAYPEGITPENLLRLIDVLAPGVTELMCHPGYAHDISSIYAREREIELATLCDPGLRSAIAERGVSLQSFAEVRARRLGV